MDPLDRIRLQVFTRPEVQIHPVSPPKNTVTFSDHSFSLHILFIHLSVFSVSFVVF